jgi:hypothetical protein
MSPDAKFQVKPVKELIDNVLKEQLEEETSVLSPSSPPSHLELHTQHTIVLRTSSHVTSAHSVLVGVEMPLAVA